MSIQSTVVYTRCLTGDTGAIGRLTTMRGDGVILDLKGHQWAGTIVPCSTFMVVGMGPTEARVRHTHSRALTCAITPSHKYTQLAFLLAPLPPHPNLSSFSHCTSSSSAAAAAAADRSHGERLRAARPPCERRAGPLWLAPIRRSRPGDAEGKKSQMAR
jgi:hypothetical protein